MPWWAQLRATFVHAPVRPDIETPPTTWRPRTAATTAGRAKQNGATVAPVRPQEPAAPPAIVEPAVGAPPRELLDRLDQAYDLEGPLEWLPDARAGSPRLRLRAGERQYMLHVIEGGPGGTLALAAEVELINFLAEHYYPVARVLKTRQEADYLRVDGTFHLLTTAEPTHPFQVDNPTHRLETAAGLAQFHELMRDYPGPLPLGPSQFLSDALLYQAGWIETNVRQPAVLRAFGRSTGFREALLNARDELHQLAAPVAAVYQEETKILIHGAYDPSAVSFDGLGLADVRNFEQIGYDVRLTDLSRSLASFCSATGAGYVCGGILDPRLLREFLSVYEQESPLTPLEASSLPLFMRANHLVRAVDECRRFVEAAVEAGESQSDLEATAVCLSLQIGRMTRPPPRRDTATTAPAST